MKKHTYVGLILFLTIAFALTSNPAFARGRHRHKHRWEDVAIGVGIAVLGDMLYHHHKGSTHVEVVMPGVHFRHTPPPPVRCESQPGHWEIERVWVPATHRKVWNPGHYNRHGQWVKGRWIRIVDQEGYWIEREIWVSP
jgi:hypothetical protein